MVGDSVSWNDIAQSIKGFSPKINYSFKLHYILSLCYLRFLPIESLYYMLTISVVSSVLSCSQPSCCHREKNGLHFLLQRKQALTFQFGCVDRKLRHQNTWWRTRTPDIGFNPNKPVSTVTWMKFYCTKSQKDLFTWKHSANKKLDKCLTICYKVWMISKCY